MDISLWATHRPINHHPKTEGITSMTNSKDIAAPANNPVNIEALDLTPEGLADAPAQQQDAESIVHIAAS